MSDDETLNEDDFHLIDELSDGEIVQLHQLMQQQWWGGKRSLDDVKSMVANSSLVVGLVETSSGKLVGFCRALTDFVFRATIYDVMVESTLQRKGLGKRVVGALCRHPEMQRVNFIYLACEPEMKRFYEQWGFKQYEARTDWMIKVQREETR